MTSSELEPATFRLVRKHLNNLSYYETYLLKYPKGVIAGSRHGGGENRPGICPLPGVFGKNITLTTRKRQVLLFIN
jgi:hypothetical protein